jgi:hypothetical protein
MVEVMPPTLVHRHGIRHDGMMLKLENRTPVPLMKAAAREAFKGLTCSEMTELIRIAEVHYTGRRPTLEKELTELLVRWLLPEASDEEVQRILEQRGQSHSRHEAVLSEEHESVVRELADEDEQESVSKTLPTRTKQPTSRTQATKIPLRERMLRHLPTRRLKVDRKDPQDTRLPEQTGTTRHLRVQRRGPQDTRLLEQTSTNPPATVPP